MMNIENLGSKESVRVKCIGGMYIEFCLKLWFESDWYFGNIIGSDDFKCNTETKFPNSHFVKSVQKQLYADVLQNKCS